MNESEPRLPSAKELVVLGMLASKREMYGLELVQASGGKLGRGTIYVTLMRMEDKGYVSSKQLMDEKSSGLPKRVFSITGFGQRALAAARSASSVLFGLGIQA